MNTRHRLADRCCSTSGDCTSYEWGVKGKFSVAGYDVGLYFGFSDGFDFILGNDDHTHITACRWRDPEANVTGESIRSDVVDWILNGGNAYVIVDGHLVPVHVVQAGKPFLRSHADGVWSDDLLALPRF